MPANENLEVANELRNQIRSSSRTSFENRHESLIANDLWLRSSLRFSSRFWRADDGSTTSVDHDSC
jgi:hypothetical protein